LAAVSKEFLSLSLNVAFSRFVISVFGDGIFVAEGGTSL
jgi:hypothetical protein